MAYFEKVKGGWRVHVEREGIRRSKTFELKSTAKNWSEEFESLIRSGALDGHDTTIEAGIKEYLHLVKVAKGDRLRLERFSSVFSKKDVMGRELRKSDFYRWVEERLKFVSGSSVVREWNTIRSSLNFLHRSGRIKNKDAWTGIQMPQENAPRKQIPTWRQIKRILRALNFYRYNRHSVAQEVSLIFLVALRTGMRQKELLQISKKNFDSEKRVVRIEDHKTAKTTGPKFVPISKKTALLFERIWDEEENLFSSKAPSVDAIFRKHKARIQDKETREIRLHDARAWALTKFSKRLTPFEVATIAGHTDINRVLKNYYRETADSIAEKL